MILDVFNPLEYGHVIDENRINIKAIDLKRVSVYIKTINLRNAMNMIVNNSKAGKTQLPSMAISNNTLKMDKTIGKLLIRMH
jgi:hypothetical protein